MQFGLTYYIYVTGFSAHTGNFEMSLSCTLNDDSDLAIPMACGESRTANKAVASVQTVDPCDTGLDLAPGLWYVHGGVGTDVEVTTCSPVTDFDTRIGVFTGSCGTLTCVGANDNVGGCGGGGSSVSFPSSKGIPYYVYVSGAGADSGNFVLSAAGLATAIPTMGQWALFLFGLLIVNARLVLLYSRQKLAIA